MNHPLVQYSPEMEGLETFQAGPLEAVAQWPGSNAGVFNEAQLLELAAETLEGSGAAALDRTLGRLIERASQTLGRPVDPALARALQGLLPRIAQQALPFPGRASAAAPAAGIGGGALSAQSTSRAAARLFGLELEGLSPEDKEFELAKSFVRLVGETVRRAVALPSTAPPQARALRAVTQAAREAAPGLFLDLDPRLHRTSTEVQNSKEATMHDIDRGRMGYANEFSGFQGEEAEFGEGEWSPEAGGAFNEAEEAELATELLAVSNEGELDRFLGNLVSRATQAVGSFVRSPAGQAVGGVLKGVAKKALPMAGAAVGSYFGGPLGARIGTGLANAAGSALGLEAEMADEDREFEGAKQFVRLAAQTAAKAASAPPGADPRIVAQQAAMAAARQLAPGLLAGTGAPMSQGPQQVRAPGGRWLRRGSKIVLYGA